LCTYVTNVVHKKMNHRHTIIIILIMSFVSLSGLFSQMKEFSHPSILSFENGTAPVEQLQTSVLMVSGDHYKHGAKSLHWQWKNDGDAWSIKSAIPYASQNPFKDNSVATFVFWVYAPQAHPQGKLIVEFLKEGKLCSWFDYGLNFQGWSGAWVAFDRDMQGKAVEGMDEMLVRVEGVKEGELFFDHILLSSFQDVRHHTADFQAPYINPDTDNHWLTLLKSWNKAFDISLSEKIAGDEIESIKTIEQRFITLLTADRRPPTIDKLTKEFNAYRIRKNKDGSLRGLPVFFERYGETYEHLGAPNYQKIYDNAMGVSELNSLMFNMAVTYRFTIDEADRKTIANMFVLLSRHIIDQGFRAGSAMGTLHHLGYSMREYYSAALLMRDVLSQNGLDVSVQQAMEWFAGTGEIKTRPDVPGMDVDAFNTSLSGRLASILMMNNSPEKMRYLKAFTRWIDNGLMTSDGTQGTFKIDGTIFHHRHNYPAYAVGGLDGAVNVSWILHHTLFDLQSSGRENLKQSLLAMRYYSNLLTWPLSLSGRHPDGKGHIFPQHFSRLALAGSPDGKDAIDKELAAAYLRLVENRPTADARIFQQAGIQPETSPQGNRSLPYSSLSVHRRGDWMVTAMGHSRYLWATESYVGANHYGRYLNHGNLQIMASGKPVSNFSSGFNQKGWDWNHFSGTTATALSMKELRADIKNLDAESGYEEMLLSDEAFAGGISLRNNNGAYAMKLHEHDKYNGSLRARKSFFFFDNRIIALGSGVHSVLPGKEVHTTLFQVYQSADVRPMQINGEEQTAYPFETKLSAKATELSDGLNNYFFVKNASVEVKKTLQHAFDEETDAPTKNLFALAYINHGEKAKENRYEYLVLVQPDANALKSVRKEIKSNKLYTVLQQDSLAHIVHDFSTKTTAYVFFEAGKPVKDNDVVSVDQPCLVMTEKPSGEQMFISICDPDLRFYEGPADDQYDENSQRIERSVYSRSWINNPSAPSEIEVVLNGSWKIQGNDTAYVCVKCISAGKTTLIVKCQHGLSREATLVKFL
jgi:chondroitin-sulfate-ABC endolyase/exolyase